MTVDTSDMLKSIFDTFSGLDYIRPEDIPNIDLYMDQVTTFMEEHLKKTRRHPGDKILTKTMTKKKYSREHMLVLIFIYYFKNLLSITDIQALLKPLTEKYFKNDKDFGMEEVYKEVFSLEKGELEKLQKDMEEKYAVSKETFKGAPEEDREFLQLFSFICILAFDTYMKKTLIEKLVDSLNS